MTKMHLCQKTKVGNYLFTVIFYLLLNRQVL